MTPTDGFQRAEVAKFDKLFRKIGRDKWLDSKFTSETGREAGVKSGISRQPAQGNERLTSRGVTRYLGESENMNDPATPLPEERTRSSHELGREFGIFGSTIECVLPSVFE